MRRLITAGILWLCLLPGTPALAASADEAKQLVEETTEAVLARLKTERDALRADKSRLYALIEDLVLPHFDFEAMSRMVLARHWRSASADQRQKFVGYFRDLLVRTYGTALLEYTGQAVRYQPVHAGDDARRVKVPTEVVASDGAPPIPIVYSLYDKKGRWQVYDISVDGVSLLLNYRNSYASQIRQAGLDGLIERMASKSASGGAGS